MRMDTRGPSIGERRTVRHVMPVSAAKIAFALALTMATVGLVGLFALYLLGMASGALRSLEGFIVSFGISEAEEFRLSFLKFLPGYVVISLLLCGITAGLAALWAVLYNLLSEIVGGVEVVTRER